MLLQCEVSRDKDIPSRCRGLFKHCPRVMSTPAAWRYRTLHLNSNLYGLWLLMFDLRMSAVADRSPCSSVTNVVCEP